MRPLSRTTRVFLATEPTDMRKGFDGLFALVENVIREDPFSGHLFVFRNQRRDRLKVLWWDRDGLAIFYKRLERGTYPFPTDAVVQKSNSSADHPDLTKRYEIRADELALLLEGIDLRSVSVVPVTNGPRRRRQRHRFLHCKRASRCSCFSWTFPAIIEPFDGRSFSPEKEGF
jgi:transposase